MKKRLAAAIVVAPNLLGGAVVITLAGADVASAQETITVCKREVLTEAGWECVEYTTCLYDSAGYSCDDGTTGGWGVPRPTVPIRPIRA
jgi:hypothetical protein